jgi:uncharacterized protein YegL
MPFPLSTLAKRPLHFIYVCDCSGSMAAYGKMQALNHAVRQSIPGMAAVARSNPEAKILVRSIAFADVARWHIESPTPVEHLEWQDLEPSGMTAMGHALDLLTSVLRSPPMESRALPPVIVLVSDGQPTDDYAGSLARLMALPWAQKAVRISIAIGHQADVEVLQKFIGNSVDTRAGQSVIRKPLLASNASELVEYIEWAATTVVGATSQPVTRLCDKDVDDAGALPEIPPTVTVDAYAKEETVLW